MSAVQRRAVSFYEIVRDILLCLSKLNIYVKFDRIKCVLKVSPGVLVTQGHSTRCTAADLPLHRASCTAIPAPMTTTLRSTEVEMFITCPS